MSLRQIVLFLLIASAISASASKPSDALLNISAPDTIRLQFIPCILNLSAKYLLTNFTLRGSVMIINFIPDRSQFQKTILKTVNEEKTHEFSVMVKDATRPHWNASHVTYKAQNYLMIIESVKEVPMILKQLQLLPTWNPNAPVLVLLNRMDQPKNVTLADEIRLIFEILLKNSMMHANIMYPVDGSNVTEVVSWFPYDGSSCAKDIENIRVIDRCESIVKWENDIEHVVIVHQLLKTNDAVRIPKNLHECPLKILSSVWIPFSTYDKIKQEFVRGIEIKMLKAVSEMMNLKPVFMKNPLTRTNLKNLTRYYSPLLDSEVDIMIGALDENAFTRERISSSVAYYQDDVTWCVSKSGPAPKWSNVFVIFTLRTWLASLAVIIIAGIALYQLNKIENIRTDTSASWAFLVILGSTMGAVAEYKPQKRFARVFFITVIFYGINFNTAYQSFLISVLTNPRYLPQVSSINKTLAAGYKLAGGTNILPYYDKNDAVSKHVTSKMERCENIDDCLKRLKNESNLAVGLSRTRAANVNLDKHQIYCFPRSNNIYTFSVTMFMKRDYHLRDKIDHHIWNILQAGLIQKWEDDAELPKKLMAAADTDRELIVLTLDHVQGAFYCWAAGIVIAVLSFIGELITARYTKNGSDTKSVAEENN